ncbi:class I adenylate-forming enzyme family protein [Methylocapsa acidiphila]|uniref:class I adenylate-forming enzyme family protein n=1 Tax=Methylocapsa acidiphila TaxID=133552 RepID=UPI00047A80CA|nr:AMP-binding protein [Methylocapsa acidiphila]
MSVEKDPEKGPLSQIPQRISQVVAPWTERAPDRIALVESSGAWTFGQLADAVAEARSWLSDQGVRAGDRVMIVNENCRALVALWLATSELDAWPVIVSARLSDREIDEIRDHCEPRRIIYTSATSSAAKAHAARHGAVEHELSLLGRAGLGSLNDATQPEPTEVEAASRVAALIYTSGTTGRPKGVMLRHSNLLFIARVSGEIRSLGPQDRVYCLLPIAHIVGLSVLVLGALMHGAALYIESRFNPVAAIAALDRDRLTIMLGTPAMYSLIAEYAKQKGMTQLAAPALRIISASGAPLDSAVKAAAERLFGLPLHNGYGISECSPTVAQIRVDRPRADCSVGPLLPGVEARLVGLDGGEAPAGEVGELWVRGPNIMKGYYRAPEETAAVIDKDGWFNTRDLARFEQDNLFIVGRTKELIIRYGFNVYPAEIEAVLNAHPAVAQSAVIGRTANGEEEVIAFVRLVPGAAATVDDLSDYATQSLAPYKRPSRVFALDVFPAGPTGKILKSQLAPLAESMIAAKN